MDNVLESNHSLYFSLLNLLTKPCCIVVCFCTVPLLSKGTSAFCRESVSFRFIPGVTGRALHCVRFPATPTHSLLFSQVCVTRKPTSQGCCEGPGPSHQNGVMYMLAVTRNGGLMGLTPNHNPLLCLVVAE